MLLLNCHPGARLLAEGEEGGRQPRAGRVLAEGEEAGGGARLLAQVELSAVQSWAKERAIGCVNSLAPPRPEGDRRRDSRNLAFVLYFMSVSHAFVKKGCYFSRL